MGGERGACPAGTSDKLQHRKEAHKRIAGLASSVSGWREKKSPRCNGRSVTGGFPVLFLDWNLTRNAWNIRGELKIFFISEFTRCQVRIEGGSSKPSLVAIRSLGTGVLVTILSRDPRLVSAGSLLRALGRIRVFKARPTSVRPPVYLNRLTNLRRCARKNTRPSSSSAFTRF